MFFNSGKYKSLLQLSRKPFKKEKSRKKQKEAERSFKNRKSKKNRHKLLFA
jgi:hypothetical protein